MYRGTTPLLILHIGGTFDWNNVSYLYVTIKDSLGRSVVLGRDDCKWDEENRQMVAQLTQAHTLKLAGACSVQMRFQYRDGLTYATNKGRIVLDSILGNDVIGRETVNTHAGNYGPSAELDPDEAPGDVDMKVEEGKPVVLPSDIKAIVINGEEQHPDEDGRVFITVPMYVSELLGGQDLIEAVEEIKGTTQQLEQITSEHSRNLKDLDEAFGDLSDDVTAAELDVITLKNQQKQTATSIEGINRRLTSQAPDIDLAKSNSQAAVTWAKNAQATANQAKTTANTTAAEVATLPKSFKTINGESIVGEGNIEIAGDKGDVQSVSVNGGTPVIPDSSGNINLEIEEGGAKSIADLEDGNRVDELESAVSSKAEQSKLNETNTKVATLEQEVGEFPTDYQKKLKAGANIVIGEDGTISASGEVSATDDVARQGVADLHNKIDGNVELHQQPITIPFEIAEGWRNGYTSNSGSQSTTTNYRRTYPIDVKTNTILRSNVNMRYVCAYDEGGSAIASKGGQNITSLKIEEGIKQIVITISPEYLETYEFTIDDFVDVYRLDLRDGVRSENHNLYDETKRVVGICKSSGSIDSSNTNYCTSDYIFVAKGESITFSSCRMFCVYDRYKYKAIDFATTSAYSYAYTYTNNTDDDVWVRFTMPIDKDNVYAQYGTSTSFFTPYGTRMIEENVYMSETLRNETKDLIKENGGNVLRGKRWAVFGDSFTNGANVGSIEGGRYDGQNANYAYLIGNRNDMQIDKFFEGGRTMLTPNDTTSTNHISLGMYQNVAEDVDYITIYIGINDSHHITRNVGADGEVISGTCSMGTIDDTDISTFYGAWNVVLEWLITNRPSAKIGVIVSNGCDNDTFRLAEIDICKKWGLPYIDLNGDERTPMMHRSTNPSHCDAVKQSRLNAFRFSDTDTHPNAEAYKYESTIIEQFLRTL